MTPFSARYAWAIGLAIALVLAPATLRMTLVEPRSECRGAQDFLKPGLFDPRSRLVTDGDRPSALDKERLVAEVDDPKRAPLVYTVVRQRTLTFGLLQPPSQLPGKLEPDRLEPHWVDADGTALPVTYAYEKRGTQIRTSAYFMAYDGRPVRSAFWTRIRASFDSLIRGPLPITLFVVSTHVHESMQTRALERLDGFLANAWQVYRDVCIGAPASGNAHAGDSLGDRESGPEPRS